MLHIALVIGCAPPRAASTPPVETGELPVATDSLARALLTDVRGVDTTIRVELRYATSNNFTGAPLPGYGANRALLQREAAQALARVARDLRPHGLVLLVFDAYRPVRATEAMMRWTQRVGRADLVRDGYIVTTHNLAVYGLCQVCAVSGETAESPRPTKRIP